MIIDPIDLNIIRQLELQGSILIEEVISKFHISRDEIMLRIRNFEDSGFIEGYGLKLFLPGIHGGKWYWVCIAGETNPRYKEQHSIPYLEEIVDNQIFPSGVSPERSYLFFTRSIKEAQRLAYKIPDFDYAEAYKISEYNITIPRLLIKQDWELIAEFYNTKNLDYQKIHSIVYTQNSESDVRLSQLIWTKKNRKGVISIFPNFNWKVIKNFLHIHIAVATTLRVKELKKIINRIGFSGNIASRYKKRYFQLEFNLWGFSEFQRIIEALNHIPRLSVEGCSFAYKNQICNDWLKEYIEERI